MAKVCPHCRTEYGPEQMVCPNDGARLSDPASTAEDPLIGQLLSDRYRVLRILGEGGMGRVYLAEHVRMGRLSAVKVMSPALTPTADAIGRFNREAANASRINHPNVAAIYDFGETADGVLYLAMEYVDGESLASLIRRDGPLSASLAGALVRQIADALHAAHHLGIIHRDLKPDNIIIAKDVEGRERVKVVDFGIAKTMQGGGQTVTTVGMSIGTPEFMSPEQLAGETLDARTDIYSLGLVTFMMLTGEMAYPAYTSKQSLVERLTSRPRSLHEVRPDIAWPPRLQSALDRALSPEPDDRYTKVADFASDVVAATRAAAADEARTRAMTPLVLQAIDPPPKEEIIAPPRGKNTRTILGAAALVVVAAIAVAIQQSTSEPTTLAVDSVKQPVRAETTVAPPDTAQSVPTAAAAPSSLTVRAPTQGLPPVAKQETPTRGTVPSVRTELRTSELNTAVASAPARREPAITPSAQAPAPVASIISPPIAPVDTSPIAPSASDVADHLSRARNFFAARQPGRAGPELGFAIKKFGEFASTHRGAPETVALRQQLTSTINDMLAMCQRPRDSSVNGAREAAICERLDKASQAAAKQEEARQGGATVFQGGRRNRPPGARNPRVPQ